MIKKYALLVFALWSVLLFQSFSEQADNDQTSIESLIALADTQFYTNIDSAYQTCQQILPLAANTKNWEQYASAICRLSEIETFWGDTTKARTLLDTAVDKAKTTFSKSAASLLPLEYQKIRNILLRNEPATALDLLDRLEKNYPPETLDQTFYQHLYKAEALLWKRAVQEARPYLQAALDIEGIEAARRQRVFVNLGYVCFLQGKLDSAAHYQKLALTLHPSAAQNRIWANMHLGLCQFVRGNWEGFIDYALESVRASDRFTQKDFPRKSLLYKLLGASYLKIGDYEKTVDYSRKASHINLLFQDTLESVSCRMNMASGLFHLGEYEESIATYKEILPIFKQNGMLKNESSTLNQLGILYDRKGEHHTALTFHRAALAKKIAALGEIHEDPAVSYYHLGTLSRALKDYDASEGYFLKCLDIRRQLKENQQAELSNTHHQLGRLYEEQGAYRKALAQFQTAIKILVPNYKATNPEAALNLEQEILSKLQLLHPLSAKALTFHGLYKETQEEHYAKASTANFECAFELLNQVRNDFLGQSSKQELVRIANHIYASAIQHQVYAYQQTKDKTHLQKAYAFAEGSKSVLLNEAIQSASAISSASIPEEVSAREQQLRLKLTTAEKELYANADAGQQAALQDSLFDTKKNYDDFVTQLGQDYPAYHQIKYEHSILSISEVQEELIDEGTAILEYFVAEKTIYVFIITDEIYDVQTIAIDFPLEQLIVQLQTSAYAYHLAGTRSQKTYMAYADSLNTSAHQLYQQLFAPIQSAYELPQRLVIMPDGILGYIPFELLLQQLPEDPSLFGGHDYLIKDYQISYSYSAGLLKEMQQKKGTGKRKDFLAFAPTFESPIAGLSRNISEIRGELGALKYNIPEVESLQQLLGGTTFIGDKATEEQFTKAAPHYKIIHLATHGKANDKVGDYAYLAFTEIKDSLENELLYNRDLYNLRLNADMVVLSACETGIGELQGGEGIISLARGFSYAGAKSIITTLWSVNDEKTKELMESFYGYIKAGKAKDVALRQAKLDFIAKYKSKAHPFYWAAFIPIGDMDAISLQQNSNLGWILGGISLFLILILFFMKNKKQN